ncbi:unnamed protein product [Linum trigynum]|uniref:Uncharacterized protein n=1 Tax=Linum trigynum TaxID=586398 RepID=A0AAV2F977_9ROSI
MREKTNRKGRGSQNLAVPRTSRGTPFPDSDSLITATGSNNRLRVVISGGRIPGKTPNPIGVTAKCLNLLELEVGALVVQIHGAGDVQE